MLLFEPFPGKERLLAWKVFGEAKTSVFLSALAEIFQTGGACVVIAQAK